MPLQRLSLNQVNKQPRPPITEQDRAIFKLRAILYKACRESVTVDKNNTGMVINKDLAHLKKKVEGTITKESGGYAFTLKVRDDDANDRAKFEANLYNVDIAVKHKSSNSKAIKGNLARLLNPDFGATVTLKLWDEGEYEILIGSEAKKA